MNIYKTPEEQLADLGLELIANMYRTTDIAKTIRRYVEGTCAPWLFRNELFVLYLVMYNLRERDIVPDRHFLELNLTLQKGLFTKYKEYIDLKDFQGVADDVEAAYTALVLKKYDELSAVPEYTLDDIILKTETYKMLYSSSEIDRSLSIGKQIVYDGYDVGRRHYSGAEDAVAYIKAKSAEVDGIVNSNNGAGYVSLKDALQQKQDQLKPIKIGDFGDLHSLNNIYKGIYTSLFYSVLAPTKGGKSKFTTRIAHTAMVEYGTNITVWPIEGGVQLWLSQLRAIHYDYVYNRGKSVTEKNYVLSQAEINQGDYPNAEVEQMEQLSKQDLLNPQYGTIDFIDMPCNVETFIDVLDTSVTTNKSQLVVIDYLQLIGSINNNSVKSQTIGKAYVNLLAYCKRKNIAVISPAQFTQEFLKEMATTNDKGGHELRTAGGESSEIVRTPDVNLAFYASIDDLKAGEMQILSMPSRISQPFAPIDVSMDLRNCTFADR